MRQLLVPVVVSGDRKWRGVSAIARYRHTEQAEYGVGSTEFAIVARSAHTLGVALRAAPCVPRAALENILSRPIMLHNNTHIIKQSRAISIITYNYTQNTCRVTVEKRGNIFRGGKTRKA